MSKTWMSVLMATCLLVCGAAASGSETKAEASAEEDIIYDVNNLTQEQQNMTELMDVATYSEIPEEVSWGPVFTLCCTTKWDNFLINQLNVAEYVNYRLRIDENFAKECISVFCSGFDGNLPEFPVDNVSYSQTPANYQEGDFYFFSQGDMGEDGEYSFRITSWVEHSDGSCTVECTRTWDDNRWVPEQYRYELIPNSYTEQFANPLFAYTIASVEGPEDAYILPESDSRLYTEVELSRLSEEEFMLAKNEIYARHGRIFTTDSIREYFESQPWYRGTVEPDDFSDSVFNEYEQANVDLMAEMEAKGTVASRSGPFSFADIDGMEFNFASGAGAWGTFLTVQADGSFTGTFHDSNMGDSDPSYPGGTIEHSEFSGQFSEPVQVNDFTWSFHIESLELITPMDTYEIKDQVRYHYCEPYGLRVGDECLIYLPGTAVSLLPEEYVGWIYGLKDKRVLSNYGLNDTTFGSGWLGYYA